MSTKVEFKRVQTDAEVENIDIKDGQLIYTGTGKTYMDYGTERIPTGSGGSSVEVDTEMSDTSENAVQNKVIKEYVDSKEEVIISDTQPIGDDWKIWIDSDEVQNSGSEIVNEYSESTGLGYSANYVNKHYEGTVLYENTNGSNGNITLSDSLNNYKYIDFIYGNSTQDEQYVKRVAKTNGRVLLNFGAIGDKLYLSYTHVNYNNLNIEPIRYYNVEISSNSISSTTTINNTYITKVIGYK